MFLWFCDVYFAEQGGVAELPLSVFPSIVSLTALLFGTEYHVLEVATGAAPAPAGHADRSTPHPWLSLQGERLCGWYCRGWSVCFALQFALLGLGMGLMLAAKVGRMLAQMVASANGASDVTRSMTWIVCGVATVVTIAASAFFAPIISPHAAGAIGTVVGALASFVIMVLLGNSPGRLCLAEEDKLLKGASAARARALSLSSFRSLSSPGFPPRPLRRNLLVLRAHLHFPDSAQYHALRAAQYSATSSAPGGMASSSAPAPLSSSTSIPCGLSWRRASALRALLRGGRCCRATPRTRRSSAPQRWRSKSPGARRRDRCATGTTFYTR